MAERLINRARQESASSDGFWIPADALDKRGIAPSAELDALPSESEQGLAHGNGKVVNGEFVMSVS